MSNRPTSDKMPASIRSSREWTGPGRGTGLMLYAGLAFSAGSALNASANGWGDGPTVAPPAAVVPHDAAPARERGVSLVQRGFVPRDRDQAWNAPVPRGGTAVFPMEFRTIDGFGNNPIDPERGAAGVPMLRLVPAAYGDGVGHVPGGVGQSSVRAVSNMMCSQAGTMLNDANASDYLWQWGQFLDHDLDETPVASPSEAFNIAVPVGDLHFDPMGTGAMTIGLDRSAGVMVAGVRQQLNNITAYIDASNVYGSEDHRALALRTLDGTGKLKTSSGNLLPYNVDGLDNAMSNAPNFFLAGDIRANEQAGLAAMHTLFVREHNRLCHEIALDNPGLTGDDIYEYARAIVAGQMQAITYNEFLPLLLGPNAIPTYAGYDPTVDAGIANVFATAAYRMGHTMLSPQILRVDANNDEISAGHLPLREAFFDPSILENDGIDPILRGLAKQHAQRIDGHIIDDVRNFLFGQPGAGGFDLASLNMQRGRDHGLGSYNDVRVAYGMLPAVTFTDMNPASSVANALAQVYATPDDVDPWIGMLCEPAAPGAMVGETLVRVLGDQFTRVRDGDRFWYETYLPQALAMEVANTSLATIIRRNTDIGAELQNDAFRVTTPGCAADFNTDTVVNVFDVVAFIVAHQSGDLSTDVNNDNTLDIQDIVAFITTWNNGCP